MEHSWFTAKWNPVLKRYRPGLRDTKEMKRTSTQATLFSCFGKKPVPKAAVPKQVREDAKKGEWYSVEYERNVLLL